MKCTWCGGKKRLGGPGGIEYCSSECRRAAVYQAFHNFDAMFDEDKERLSKADVDRLIRRSSRWDPESMQERIEELKSAVIADQNVFQMDR